MLLKMTRGDTFQFQCTIKRLGVAVDVTNATFTMTAKYSHDQTSAIFTKTSPSTGITLTTPASGIITVTIAPSDTSNLPPTEITLVYDIQMVESDTSKHTILSGELIVKPDVTTS